MGVILHATVVQLWNVAQTTGFATGHWRRKCVNYTSGFRESDLALKLGCWNPRGSQCNFKGLQPLSTIPETSSNTCTHTHMHKRMHAHTHTCTHTHTHTHAHTHTYTHTHTHTHTNKTTTTTESHQDWQNHATDALNSIVSNLTFTAKLHVLSTDEGLDIKCFASRLENEVHCEARLNLRPYPCKKTSQCIPGWEPLGH